MFLMRVEGDEDCLEQETAPHTRTRSLITFFINFSPQLPQRQLPGLQHLSAFGHELDFSDFLLPGFQENNSNHIPKALPPHPASACRKG